MITESPGWWKRIVRRAAEDGLGAALPKYERYYGLRGRFVLSSAGNRSVNTEGCRYAVRRQI